MSRPVQARLTMETTKLQYSGEGVVDVSDQQGKSEATRSSGEDVEVMSSLQAVQVTGCAMGWDQSHNSSLVGESSMQDRWLPKLAPEIEDEEGALRDTFIKHMTKYEGAAIAPIEEFELSWTTMNYELEQYMVGGLVPQDSIASSGLNKDSYSAFKVCAEELQNNLFEYKLLESLGNLRGFRRLFSQSKDPILKHAFCGRPIEVLQNIYYGGDGILPEDRMLEDDPFHYKKHNKDDDMIDD